MEKVILIEGENMATAAVMTEGQEMSARDLFYDDEWKGEVEDESLDYLQKELKEAGFYWTRKEVDRFYAKMMAERLRHWEFEAIKGSESSPCYSGLMEGKPKKADVPRDRRKAWQTCHGPARHGVLRK